MSDRTAGMGLETSANKVLAQAQLPSTPASGITNYLWPATISVVAARRLLVMIELAVVLLAAILSKYIYIDLLIASYPGTTPLLAVALGLWLALFTTYKHMGLYDTEDLLNPDLQLGKLMGGIAIAFLLLFGTLYFLRELHGVSRGWVLTWIVVLAGMLVASRAYFVHHMKRGLSAGLLTRRMAIVGPGEFALEAADLLNHDGGPANQIHLYSNDALCTDPRFAGSLSDLQSRMVRHPYERVVVAIPAAKTDDIRHVVRSLGAYASDLLLCTNLSAQPIRTNGARHIGSLRTEVIHLAPICESSWLLKRCLDLVVAGAAFVVLSPLLLLVAAAIKLDSPGPVLFRQRRIGQSAVPFTIYKFRSMTVAEDGDVVVQATRDDARVTRVGRFLRSTSIDELPQLINVLLGQMSIVGPRPHAIAHDEKFEQQLDLFSRRRRVKPGITGWAQIHGFRGETITPEDVRLRMEHDLYYIDRWSIWLDIEIIARTFFVFARKAY